MKILYCLLYCLLCCILWGALAYTGLVTKVSAQTRETRVEKGLNKATVANPTLTLSYALPVDCLGNTNKKDDKECVITAITDKDDTNAIKRDLYYTLGGVRLRFDFDPLSLNKSEQTAKPKYSWVLNVAGKRCTSFADVKCDGTTGENEAKAIKDITRFWWEPTTWSTKLSAEAVLKIVFEDSKINPDKKIRFKVATRELKPVVATTSKPDLKPMKGSDVKMLEQMLWQLGITPQSNNFGSGGARTNSDRGPWKGKELGWTMLCDGETRALKRDIFYPGWGGCKSSTVSMERMVKRFQGRNVSNSSGGAISGGSGRDGVVGNGTLKQLNRAWSQYLTAYLARPEVAQILNSAVEDAWLQGAVDIWEDGFEAASSGAVKRYAKPTYTEDIHKILLSSAGIEGVAQNDMTRVKLLRAWKTEETSSHWGEGSPVTDFRMTEGNADEFGSLSFNQVLYQYRYSDKPCIGHKESELNFYDPVENIQAFALHTALTTTATGNCPGAFYLAYNKKNLGSNYSSIKPIKYRQGSGALKTVGTKDDNYEIFAKAIAVYNGGSKVIGKHSWPDFIRSSRKPVITGLKEERDAFANKIDAQCFSCNYSISVRNVKFGLPYRTYIWKGGETTEVIPGDAATTPPIPESKVTTDWCFAYGEKEWVNPGKDVTGKLLDWVEYKKRATRKINLRTLCE